MKIFVFKKTTLLMLLLAFGVTFLSAQEEVKKEKKVVVITKTVDEDGNVTVEKKVTEGGDADDEEIKKMTEEAEKEIEVQVRVNEKKAKKYKQKAEKGAKKEYKTYKIDVDSEGDEDGEHKVMIFKSDDGDENVFIFDGDEKINLNGEDVKVIKKKGKDGEEIEIEIQKIDGGGSHGMIHKMHKGNGAFLGVMANPAAEGAIELIDVVEGSPAEKAGLKKGDILESINGKGVSDFNGLVEVLSELKPDDEVEIGYTREGSEQTTKAVLTEGSGQNIEKIIEVHTEISEEDKDGDDNKMIWIQKGDDDDDDDEKELKFGDADEIIIEETIEETEENGKKIIKKKKTIKKIKKE